MKHLIVFAISVCAAATPAIGDSWRNIPVPAGTIDDSNPTRPGLHDYSPPTPVGRGHGNAYFGAGYIEYLFSGGPTPHLPPKRVYVGPVEGAPYGNRRLRLRQGMSPRGGVYVGLPEHTEITPYPGR
jgi:hypothetical protein